MVRGQYYSSGQDPASTKWLQINTSNFQIIFPETAEKPAQYLANILDSAYSLVAHSLDGKIKKTSVILHNQSVLSNGTTAWAPTRIDLVATSPQNTYPHKWLDQLALHEIRHLIQIEKLNTGLTKVLKVILGEHVLAFMTGIFVPQWFLEGDAVVTETALSESGRGREPAFTMPFKAQLLDKKIYSYEKAVHGSFKDMVPEAYPLGYLLVASGRNKFGSKIWKSSLTNTGKNPFLITPFSKAIKNASGLSKQQFYTSVMEDLKFKWDSILSSQNASTYDQLTKKPKHFTNYRHPMIYKNQEIISVKKSMDDVKRFVKIDSSGEEEIIFTPGPNLGDRLSYANYLLCWSEIEFDTRWQNRNYSVIKTYNLKTKKLTQLSKKSRYFSPALSNDATKIALVEQGLNDESALVILDAKDGHELKRYPHPDLVMMPAWSADDDEIVFINLNSKGKGIQTLHVKTGETEKTLSETFEQISSPRITDAYIYFTGAFSGTDNIYAVNKSTKHVSQISQVKFGADHVFVDEQNEIILFSNYTSNGYEIVKQNYSPDEWIPLDKIQKTTLNLAETYSRQEKGILNINQENNKEYEVKKYYKASGLLNIHSWAPASIDVNSYEVKPGFSLMSQNKLSTAFATMGYEYDLNESLGKYYFNYSYQGFYPIIDLSVDNGKRRRFYSDSTNQIKSFTYKETNIETEIKLPISLSKGRYQRGIQPSVKFKNSFLNELPGSNIKFSQNAVHSLHYRLYFYNTQRASLRDLYPKWGQILDLRIGNTPLQNENKSWIASVSSVLYFPGLVHHHGFKIFNGYQKRQEGVYYFPQQVNYPRGFFNRNDTELYRTSLNYKMPLWYPDFNVGSLMYLKRLKLAFYYDYAFGKHPDGNTTYRSTGFELTSDLHLLSLIAPIDMGFRYIYYPDKKSSAFEFLFSIDFSALY